MSLPNPLRGEVWFARFDPVVGHEQAGTRPALIVSYDRLNQGPAGLVMAMPLSTVDKQTPLHVRVDPPEGGLTAISFIRCEDLRSLSKLRFIRRLGWVDERTMRLVEDRNRILLSL